MTGRFGTLAGVVAAKIGLRSPQYTAKGSFKETFRAFDSVGAPVALKICDPDMADVCRTNREIGALLKCSSPRLGGLRNHLRVPWRGKTYVCMVEEYFDAGSLEDRLRKGPLPVDLVRTYGLALLDAIEHLASRNLVHRDIKPANIMFRNGDPLPVLIDFGIVRNLGDTSLTASWAPQGPGTPLFSSPEQLNNQKALIDWRSDQFGLGLVLGICLTGAHPFASPGMGTAAIVERMGRRGAASPEFRADVQGMGCDWILPFIARWPVQRYQSIEAVRSKLR